MRKICIKCKEDKSLDEFNKGKGLHKKHSWCRKCQSEYYKKKVAGEIKRPEKNVCPYKDNTVESDLFIHFYRFNVSLEPEQIKEIKDRIKSAENLLVEMDRIEAELGCKYEDYDLSGIEKRFKDK